MGEVLSRPCASHACVAALFERRAKYDMAVHMSKHPVLNEYIGNVGTAAKMRSGTKEKEGGKMGREGGIGHW